MAFAAIVVSEGQESWDCVHMTGWLNMSRESASASVDVTAISVLAEGGALLQGRVL